MDPARTEIDVAAVGLTPMAERYTEVFEAAIATGPLPGLLAGLAVPVLAVLGYLVNRGNGGGTATLEGMTTIATPRRRILLVINLLFWAGAETQLRNLAIGLRRLGHDVTLLAVEDITSHAEDLEAAGVKMRTLGARSRFAKLRALPALIGAALDADVVHCTGWDASLWGRLAAIAARRPVVVTDHAGDRSIQVSRSGASRAGLIALHNRRLDRFTNATVVVSEAQSPQLESEGVRPDSIVFIPNGVPVAELQERAEDGCRREALGIPAGAKVVAHVARFAAPKNQEATLRAVERLRERFDDVRVLFVGDGETEERVRAVAAEMGADWATFLGKRDDVPALLRLADVAVLPSTAEGLPMSLIESIAVGTPVVATDVGDVSWLLELTGGGLCVPKGCEKSFADACSLVLGDPELGERLRLQGLERVGEFDATRMVDRYSILFEEAVRAEQPTGVREELALRA